MINSGFSLFFADMTSASAPDRIQESLPPAMKAVVLTEPSPAEKIRLTDYPVPKVRLGWVLVRVKAFGLNHSEQLLRLSEIQTDYIQKPIIPGIECAGEIIDPSDSTFVRGQKVVALMGGMGRSFNGSYAQYSLLPAHYVFPVLTRLSWEETAAVPETYFTAWGSLFECLRLKAEDVLLIRGATCALGYAALQLAKALGCKVIATTHRREKIHLLKNADAAVLDDGSLTKKLQASAFPPITKALDLVGSRYLKDTLTAVAKGGIVCSTGILGGIYSLNGFDPIKDIPNGVYLTGFFSNYPTAQTMADIYSFLDHHNLTPSIGAVYPFSHIAQALYDMDSHKIDGKIVIRVN